MKKKRYFPFGYHMENGKILTVPDEAALVLQVYTQYISGASLQILANMADSSGIRYSEASASWNKNMIHRILTDTRYCGENGYPQIVPPDTALQAQELLKLRAAPKTKIPFPLKMISCSVCGGILKRTNRNNTPLWHCQYCKYILGPLSDAELIHSAVDKFLRLCHDPGSAENVPPSSGSISLKAIRLTNEISRGLNSREPDADELLPSIFECAAEKYSTCSIKGAGHLTLRIKELLSERSNDAEVHWDTFNTVVKQVIIKQDLSTELVLINDAKIY